MAKYLIPIFICLLVLCIVTASFAGTIYDAAAKGELSKITALVKAKPESVNSADKDGATALHYAVAAGQIDAVKLLIKNKADVNAKKKNGVTPIHIASSLGKKDIVNILLVNKADANIKDNLGRTPLSLAREKGWTEIADLLAAQQLSIPTSRTNTSEAKKESSGPLTVALEEGPYTVFRQTENGNNERQIILRFTNSKSPITLGKVTVGSGHNVSACNLEPIPTGESHDVIWVSSDATSISLKSERSNLLQANIDLPAVQQDKMVIIPRSPIIKNIPPLAIRGTNYMPSDHPWPGLPRDATMDDFEKDFSLMNKMFINTMRTFTFFDPDLPDAAIGLYYKDGCATTKAQKHLNDLLTVADRHHIKVILMPPADIAHEELAACKRSNKSLLGPFINDGRILMVDVYNEVDSWDDELWNKSTKGLKELYDYTREIYPNHLLTVGLAYRFDRLQSINVVPDVAQYHDYSGGVGKQPAGQPYVRNVSNDLANTKKTVNGRPILIGEFGQSTAGTAVGGTTEERQREIYQGVFEGAEDQRILGVMNWQMFDFIPGWMGTKEQVFGMVRTNGSLKPAGELLKQTYAQWAKKYPAPWDTQ